MAARLVVGVGLVHGGIDDSSRTQKLKGVITIFGWGSPLGLGIFILVFSLSAAVVSFAAAHWLHRLTEYQQRK